MATLDDISGGRVALNIVTGWNKPEYAQMGLWRGDEYYEQRYAYALDYVHVLRTLWRDGTMTHHSPYFDLDDCQCLPTPTHEIPLVSAGQSSAGQDFVSRIGGHSFAMVAPERLHAIASGLKQAGAKYGTRVGIYGLFQIVAAETDDQAWQTAADIVAGGDIEAIKSLVYSASLDTVKGGTSGQFRNEDAGADEDLLAGDIEAGNMVFMNVPVLVGSYETIARKIDNISKDQNIEGMLFTWPDWVAGIQTFGDRILPLLNCRKDWDGATMGDLRTLRADF
jgi:pyrimidine oxygenase